DWFPPQKRVEAKMLHSDSVLDQRLDVRHLRISGEIWHRDAECPIQTSHHKLLCCRTPICRGETLAGVEPFGIELAHEREFLIRRRLGHPQVGRELQGKSNVVLKLLSTDA